MIHNDSEELKNAAKILSVNQDEAEKANERTKELIMMTDDLSKKNDEQSEELDKLLNSLGDLDSFDSNDNYDDSKNKIKSQNENPLHDEYDMKPLMYMKTSNDFNILLNESNEYSQKCNLDVSNPYLSGLSEVEINKMSLNLKEKYELSNLDKWDYIFAGFAGIIGGLTDAFFVGSITDGNNPKTINEQGIFGKKTDDICKILVKKFASFESGKPMESASQAIRWLEKEHKVSYDASNNGRIIDDMVKGMDPSNHHLFSLAHDPGPLGLFFGILDQLDGKSSFLSDGHLIRVVTTSAESSSVTGQSGPLKIVEATKNWFGHICSDISGASGSKGRGAGLPAPFYELTQKLNFGSINIKGKDKTFAEVSEWLFKQGLDYRAFIAQSIPVLIMETLVRLYWVYKKHFYYGKSWKESFPKANQLDLQKLLLTSTATFETVDIADAIVKNGLNYTALLRINYANVLDLSFRSLQVLRSSIKNVKRNIQLDKDFEAERYRVYQTI